MSHDKNDDRESQGSSGLTFPFVLMLPVLYILSIGPFAYFMTHNAKAATGSLETFLMYFYSPLNWLHDNTWFEYPLEWYVNLWM